MSGRSAYVRKKITETKQAEKPVLRGRAKSSTSSDDNATISDLAVAVRQDPGIVGPTSARLLKFSEPLRDHDGQHYRHDYPSFSNQSSGSLSGGSLEDRREAAATPQFKGPLEDFAYARARKPVIKTEDISGIAKSGLRTAVDKKSEEVRKGLVKAFTFRKKEKRLDIDRTAEFRPFSSATVRPDAAANGGRDLDLDEDDLEQYAHNRSPIHYEQPWDDIDYVMAPPPSAKLPPIPTGPSVPPMKRWLGAGRPVQKWNKLRKDPELWHTNGDVLVFFGHKGQQPRPYPSFRLSSHIIEATESRYLVNLLRDGCTEESISIPPSPMGSPPPLQRHMSGGPVHGSFSRQGGQASVATSDDLGSDEYEGQISYEMYFPTPSNLNKIDQLRHQITTRNVFALLHHVSLVGLSLYQALSDLHTRLETYMPPDADNVGTIINYLGAHGIDDVRNDPEGAVSLLAWSESPEVRWEEGWTESFIHCAGLYSSIESCTDFKNITPITRALLERATLETELRVHAAEERLADFQYTDLWPSGSAHGASSGAKAAAERLQKFFISHYNRSYGRWPPLAAPKQFAPGTAISEPEEDMWLTRRLAQELQRDFGSLYDFLVNRDIVWDGSETRPGRKWMLVSESGNRAFEADTPDLPMTDMLVEFDNRLRFPHIPHPYPLIPESIPPASASAGKDKSAKRNGNMGGGNGLRTGAVERRVQLAYTEATNMLILGSEFTQSDLIDAFSKFEKADRVGEVDPCTARRGRWVLIYGILQTLASVSVDAPNLRYRDEVDYHLSPRLKGARMPPWKHTGVHAGAEEAAHELSHCWIAPLTWGLPPGNHDSSAASSGGSRNGSPVGRSWNFPRPPGSTSTARSSLASYQGMSRPLGSRTGATYAPPPGFGSAASVISETETDTASSIRTPASAASVASSRRGSKAPRERKPTKTPVKAYLDEASENALLTVGEHIERGKSPAPLLGGGGSAMLSSSEGDDARSYTTAPDRVSRARRGGGGGGTGKSGTREDKMEQSARTMFRDFDDLDVIDDHRP